MDEVTICNLALARLGDSRIVTFADAKPEAEYCALFYEATRDEVLRAHPWNFATKLVSLPLSWVAFSGFAFTSNGAGGIRVTHMTHGLETGDRIHIKDVQGVPANGSWRVTRVSAYDFDLIGSTFSGSHVSSTGAFLKAPLFGWSYFYTLPADFLRLLQLNAYDANEPTTRWEVGGGLLLTNEEEANVKYVYKVTDENLFDPLFVDALTLKLAAKLAKPLTGSSQLAEGFLTEYLRITAPLARRIDASEAHPIAKPAWVDSSLVHARFGSEIG